METDVMAGTTITCKIEKIKKEEKHTIISIDKDGKVVTSVIFYKIENGKVSVSSKVGKLSPYEEERIRIIATNRAEV